MSQKGYSDDVRLVRSDRRGRTRRVSILILVRLKPVMSPVGKIILWRLTVVLRPKSSQNETQIRFKWRVKPVTVPLRLDAVRSSSLLSGQLLNCRPLVTLLVTK